LGTVRVLASFSPPIAELRPSVVRFQPSDFYGAATFATARHWIMLAIVSQPWKKQQWRSQRWNKQQLRKKYLLKYPVQLLSPSTFLTLCMKYRDSAKTQDEHNSELLQKDWLTSGLIHEIETLFPNPSEINTDDDNKRDSLAFQRKIALLVC
jgi:hypothetical protein